MSSDRQTRLEGAEINKSLLALKVKLHIDLTLATVLFSPGISFGLGKGLSKFKKFDKKKTPGKIDMIIFLNKVIYFAI